MRMKQWFVCVLMIALLSLPTQTAIGAQSKYKLKEITIELFGELTKVDQALIPRNRYTFIPVADLLKPLGYEVLWDEKKATLTAKKKDSTIQLKVGSKSIYINDVRKRLPISPKLIRKRVFIPLRQVTDLLGFTFETNAANQIRIFDPLNRTQTVGRSKGIMWRANKGQKEMFLIVHPAVASKTIGPLPEPIAQAFQNAGSLSLESNLYDPPVSEIQTWISTNGVYGAGAKLQDQLSADQVKALQKRLKELNLSIQQFETVEPWLCAMLLSQYQAEIAKDKQEDLTTFDIHLLELARKKGKTVFEWISAASMLQMYDQMPQDLQLAYLKQVLETKGTATPDQTEALKKAWTSGDLKTFQALVMINTKKPSSAWQAYIEETLNQKIADKLLVESSKQNKPIFVLLQPMHIFSKWNVLNLLEKSGYTVKIE